MTNNNLHCPDCNNPLAKAGSAISGKRRVQQYRCPICQRRTMRPLDSKGNKIEAKAFREEPTS